MAVAANNKDMLMTRNRVFSASSMRSAVRIAFCALASVAVFWHISGSTGETATALPVPEVDSAKGTGTATDTAVLAGGCFWGVQGVFQYTKGVKNVLSGYSGGE